MLDTSKLGLVVANPPLDGSHFGGLSSIDNTTVLCPDGNWTPYLPPSDLQRNSVGDTFACVTFSAINAIEMMMRRLYPATAFDFSERFTAKQDGTVPGVGNDFWTVGECIKKNGLLSPEDSWPYSPGMSITDFYAPLSQDLIGQAKKLLDAFSFDHESVWDDPNHIVSALKFAPVQVAIHAYGSPVNGVYQRTEDPGNHAIVIFNAVPGQYFEAFDSEQDHTIKLAWNTRFWGAQKFAVSKAGINPPSNQSMYQFKEGVLYQLVEGIGGFMLYAAGKLRYDDIAKLLASWEVRNGGDTKGKVGTLTMHDLNGVQLYDLKNNPVNL